MRKPRYEIFETPVHWHISPGGVRSVAGTEWRWRLVAANGEIVASGEGYVSKANAKRAVRTFTKLAQQALEGGIDVLER